MAVGPKFIIIIIIIILKPLRSSGLNSTRAQNVHFSW
jgi:hypothetical protein